MKTGKRIGNIPELDLTNEKLTKLLADPTNYMIKSGDKIVINTKEGKGIEAIYLHDAEGGFYCLETNPSNIYPVFYAAGSFTKLTRVEKQVTEIWN